MNITKEGYQAMHDFEKERADRLEQENARLAAERRQAIEEANRFEEAYQLIYHKLQVANNKLEDK